MRNYKPKHADSVAFFEGYRQVWVLLLVMALMAGLATWLVTSGSTRSSANPQRATPHHVVKVADVDPEAKGVNEGTKKQAAGIKMKPITRVDAEKVAGRYGESAGCVPGYGRAKQCLPPVSPAAVAMKMTAEEHPWDCDEVRKLFRSGIAVNKKGVDPLRLDYNRDGVACGHGD